VSAPTPHLRPHADVAERVLLPGDPGRALRLAQQLTEGPRMLNHHRGLWGYTGPAADGAPLTVQSTGMGGPSAAIVAEELIGLGAETLIRIGTCGALIDELELGTLLPVGAALAADGASRALGADGSVPADEALAAALSQATEHPPVTCVSTDLFYDQREELPEIWLGAGATVVEMEAAAVMQVARNHGVPAACLLAVTDQLADGRVRADFEQVEEMGLALGETAWSALEKLSA
jgi:uridine phosphorylase